MCSGHGSPSCNCDQGYTGAHCGHGSSLPILTTTQGRSQGGRGGGAGPPPKSGGSQKYIRGDPCDLGSEAKNRGSAPPKWVPPPKPNPGYALATTPLTTHFEEINFCNSTCPSLGLGLVGSVCGPNGDCASEPSGAVCHCRHGWTGALCRSPVPGEVRLSLRCVLEATPETTAKGWTRIGCADTAQRCLPDDLNCGFQACDYPVGWCLPKAAVDLTLQALSFKL